MKKLLLPLLLIPSLSFADRLGSLRSNADVLLTTQAVAGSMSPGATYYVNVTSSLQSGATFYVSSGTIRGPLYSTSLNLGGFTAPGHNINSLFFYDVGTLSAATGWDNANGIGYFWNDGSSNQRMNLRTDNGTLGVTYGVVAGSITANTTISGRDISSTYGVTASSVATSSITASGQIRATSLLVNSTFTINSVGVCLADGTNCTSTGSGGMSPGATYYVQVRDTLQSGATFYVSSGTVSGQLSVSTLTFIGSGLLTATQNGFTGPILISTGIPTTGQAVIAASSYSIVATPLRSTILAVDSNGVLISTTVSSSSGSGSGSVVASPYGQVPYYSGVDTNTLTGNPNFTMDTTSWTVHMDSVAALGVLFDYGTSSMTVSSVTAANVTLPSLTSKSCLGTDSSGLVINGTCSGGGGSSSLAVGNGTSSTSNPIISSPTAIINADNATMVVTLTGSATAFLSLNPSSVTLQGNNLSATYLTNSSATATYQNIRQAIALSSFSATQPIVYDSGTGSFSATPISLSSGVVGVLPIANGGTNTSSTLTGLVRGGASYTAAEISGDGTTSGSNVLTLAALQNNITTFGSSITVTGAGIKNTYGIITSSVAASSITVSGQLVATGVTVNELTASQFVVSDTNKKLASSLNGSSLTSLTGANIASVIPSSVLPSTVNYIDAKQTISGHKTFSSSQTYTGSQYISSTTILSNGPGTSGQLYTSQGPGATPQWTTVSGGGYATVQDEGSGLTQRTTLNFTGTGVSCADNAGSTRTDCTINSGAATAGGSPGNVQYNSGGSIVGASAFNVWTSSIVVSTGASTGYELYGTTLAVVSSTTLSGITKIFASTFTNTAQWDQKNSFTFDGRQGYTDQIMKSSGTGVAPKWGAIHKIMTTTATITATGTTPSDVLQLQYNLIDLSTYTVRCRLVFQTTATTVGAGAGVFVTVGSTIAASVDVPVAADGTAGGLQGWLTTNADSVLGTGVQAANTNYVIQIEGVVFAGTSASVNPRLVAEGGTGQMTLRAGSVCIYEGDDPRP